MAEAKWWRAPTLQKNDPGDHRKATWLELFYDLIYVVAVARLASGLAHHASLAGLVEFVALFFPVWWSWAGVTFYNDRFGTDDLGDRLFTLVQMLAVVGLALGAGQGAAAGGVAFAASYALARLALVGMYLRVAWHEPQARPLARRYATGFGASAALWLASILVPAPLRYAFWAVGMLVDIATPLTARHLQARLPVSTSHLPERFGLFTIIVLGEGVAAVVAGASGATHGPITLVAGALGLLLAFAIWWAYFENLDEAVVRRTRVAGQVWFYSHFPLAMGITATAVGVELVLHHGATHALPLVDRWILGGGFAAALAMLGAIQLTTRDDAHAKRHARGAVVRLSGAGAALIATLLLGALPSLALVGALALVGLAQVAADPPVRGATHHA